ncbi:MAG: hypothetical protein IAG10_08655, partial [Planctomycetaceae bacterium]|nr:hypothetical protein [Planctomycetaceae bacterium]
MIDIAEIAVEHCEGMWLANGSPADRECRTMMKYELLKQTGALHEGASRQSDSVADRIIGEWSETSAEIPSVVTDLAKRDIPASLIELIPESVARESLVIPLAFDGERLTVASTRPDDIALADKLRFILALDVRLVHASEDSIRAAINQHYTGSHGESVDSMLSEFTETAIDFDDSEPKRRLALRAMAIPRHGPVAYASPEFKKGAKPIVTTKRIRVSPPLSSGEAGMFFYMVPEGQRVLMTDRNGKKTILIGPQRVWRGSNSFEPMRHAIAHPGEFLVVRHRDGTQQNIAGPAEVWLDPRIHDEVTTEEALQIAAKEAVVVYSQSVGSAGTVATTRRIVHGPTLFVPQPGEWLHKFSWHASKGGSHGVEKTPNGLVFQKLWLMPDQMYHDVHDVRTADDAVLTIRLMLFFELTDIDRMLDSTHDPIGDFVNAATADVVEFTVKHDFETFKRNTHHLNDLATYKTLI